MTVKAEGIEQAQRVLSNVLNVINIESELLVNEILQGISRRTLPYVPVGETSNLINSEVRQTERNVNKITGHISFFATTENGEDYAKFVHEGPQKNWQKPGASNFYLLYGTLDFIEYDLSDVIKRFRP